MFTIDETNKVVSMEEALHKRVVGQDAAVTAISCAIRRARPALGSPKQTSRHIRRTDRRVGKQDRAGQGSRRLVLRLRGRHGPAGHERVHGQAHGVHAADQCSLAFQISFCGPSTATSIC
jgi:hypothetical protein